MMARPGPLEAANYVINPKRHTLKKAVGVFCLLLAFVLLALGVL